MFRYYIVIFQGRFEVLSLSGLFLLSENGQRTGSLSVALAGPDGRVFGGRVAGSLTAASPVQVPEAVSHTLVECLEIGSYLKRHPFLAGYNWNLFC
jgi:predicted DNA-binding protein with PD1-like motif